MGREGEVIQSRFASRAEIIDVKYPKVPGPGKDFAGTGCSGPTFRMFGVTKRSGKGWHGIMRYFEI